MIRRAPTLGSLCPRACSSLQGPLCCCGEDLGVSDPDPSGTAGPSGKVSSLEMSGGLGGGGNGTAFALHTAIWEKGGAGGWEVNPSHSPESGEKQRHGPLKQMIPTTAIRSHANAFWSDPNVNLLLERTGSQYIALPVVRQFPFQTNRGLRKDLKLMEGIGHIFSLSK